MEVRLAAIYATPLRPDDTTWDGPDAGLVNFACTQGAEYVRRQFVNALNAQLYTAGNVFDRYAGEQFQSTVAEACGLAANWLTQPFEGPEIYAQAWYSAGAAPLWETVEMDNSWIHTPARTESGGFPVFTIPCANDGWAQEGYSADIDILDRDLVEDDVIALVTYHLSNITPDEICNGWAVFEGIQGVAATIFEVVPSADSSCYR